MKIWTTALLLLATVLIAAGCAKKDETSPSANGGKPDYKGLTLKLGVQGSGGMYAKAREEKWFEKAYEPLGVKVEWAEFQSGPPMTEAMASDKLDFASLGNMPVIAAQSAGIKFQIISQILDGKRNTAIIVPADSPLKDIRDLKGKKVAVTKGSNAYNLLTRGLHDAGVNPADVEVIQLQPNEAQPAFDSGKVDAWAAWDPYITVNTLTGKGKVLAEGETLGVLAPSFVIVRKEIADKYPELATVYLSVLEKARLWEEQNSAEVLKRYAADYKIPEAVVGGMLTRSKSINIPVSEATAAELQKTADFQESAGTIRKKIKVADAVNNTFIEEALKAASAAK
ncbi:aliphatic sulfonate ABC transporter substrate-binding protein [Paenibacillus chitinolyticus]|uniref:aliphatic sulfonate ABC transporter substrate-binding protein n=1 Tax=Paenibacillus chitinolyticus TaxID=79263 RepID=UPI001C48394F|nr:aliphatic sulfonate ABC transporter substrate-binding protein [Paenibacillus chitinolyticus]MBV6713276.1 aliphatic sulfonate ABC transporter substrate-binding protein [Paenibacillus chitinolyticus]